MRLLRGGQGHELQIRFDGEEPDSQYRAKLLAAGWADETEPTTSD